MILSWWGKNAAGEEILCRVTRAAAKPGLGSISEDRRLLGLVELADEKLVVRRRDSVDEQVSVIFKAGKGIGSERGEALKLDFSKEEAGQNVGRVGNSKVQDQGNSVHKIDDGDSVGRKAQVLEAAQGLLKGQ